jgi:hypothetical protein
MDLVVVTVLPDIVSATAVKAMLDQAEIPVMLRSAGSANWLIPGTPGGAGPLEVMVPAERLDEARRLVSQLEGGTDDGDGDGDADAEG